MNLSGRRQSSNVEDRRGKGGKIAGFGIGGGIVAVILALLLGGNPSDLLQQFSGSGQTENTEYVPTEQEKEFEVFLNSTCKCNTR